MKAKSNFRTVVKHSYLSVGGTAKAKAKAHVNYVAFRPGKDKDGSQAALVFWFADGRRIRHSMADLVATWDCSLAFGQRQIPLSRGLWIGSSASMQEIRVKNADGKPVHVGFYVQKISA